uniref:Uncharacterized protein n=1 Tax=viral metagenome TaxID=1070528 RepID=A0A6C0BC34_9ZZZZ
MERQKFIKTHTTLFLELSLILEKLKKIEAELLTKDTGECEMPPKKRRKVEEEK